MVLSAPHPWLAPSVDPLRAGGPVPGDQDRRRREVERPRPTDPPPRARLERDRRLAGYLDQAAAATGPVQRQQLSSLFEPERSDPGPDGASQAASGNPLPTTLSKPPGRTRWAWLLVAPAVTLAVGMVLGLVLGSGRVGREPTSAPAAPRPAAAPVTSVVVRPTASSACLETARRADEVIQLLLSNRRTRAANLLVAYTVANRQCRRDAAP
jgi:hypothetical protein